MRSLAGAFSVAATVRNDDSVTRRLRGLPQPIFRYGSRDPEVLDGAIFAFVEGTEPELLLAIEARKTANGFEWQYAIGRLNSIRRASCTGIGLSRAMTSPVLLRRGSRPRL